MSKSKLEKLGDFMIKGTAVILLIGIVGWFFSVPALIVVCLLAISAIALVKLLMSIDNPSLVLVLLTIVYTLLAIGFGALINSTPSKVSS